MLSLVLYAQVSVHPAFLHLAVGVDSVSQTLETVRLVDQDARRKAEENKMKGQGECDVQCKRDHTKAEGIIEINVNQLDPPKPTEVVLQTDSLALLRNFDGYPVLLVEKREVQGYYQALCGKAHPSL